VINGTVWGDDWVHVWHVVHLVFGQFLFGLGDTGTWDRNCPSAIGGSIEVDNRSWVSLVVAKFEVFKVVIVFIVIVVVEAAVTRSVTVVHLHILVSATRRHWKFLPSEDAERDGIPAALHVLFTHDPYKAPIPRYLGPEKLMVLDLRLGCGVRLLLRLPWLSLGLGRQRDVHGHLNTDYPVTACTCIREECVLCIVVAFEAVQEREEDVVRWV